MSISDTLEGMKILALIFTLLSPPVFSENYNFTGIPEAKFPTPEARAKFIREYRDTVRRVVSDRQMREFEKLDKFMQEHVIIKDQSELEKEAQDRSTDQD